MRSFAERVKQNGNGFHKRKIDVLQVQVNMGKYCNQACLHCHVEAGPGRKEMMNRETVEAVLRFLETSQIPTVDITGGAPELSPHFDYMVESCVRLGRHVMDRCNLTVIFEPGKEYLPEFFKQNRVEVICSLPCYTEENVDRQRGKGTFDLSIRALQIFNSLSYGQPGSGLILNLAYNPVGPHLPPPQEKLEQDYKRELRERFDIEFNRLYCLTNMPITRYETHLKRCGEYHRYMELLEQNFNLATVEQVMCRSLLSVGWEGSLYDCDFNQMLDLSLTDREGNPLKIWNLSNGELENRPILIRNHCYGCAAGSGSSCGGALVS